MKISITWFFLSQMKLMMKVFGFFKIYIYIYIQFLKYLPFLKHKFKNLTFLKLPIFKRENEKFQK